MEGKVQVLDMFENGGSGLRRGVKKDNVPDLETGNIQNLGGHVDADVKNQNPEKSGKIG